MNSKIKLFIKIFFTVLLVGLILRTVGLVDIVSAFKQINILLFILAFTFAPLFLFFKASKWCKLVKEEIPDVSFKDAAKSFLAGWGVALLTPARIGELARVFYFGSGNKLRLTAFVIFDKIFDFTVLVLLSLFGIGLFFGVFYLILFSIIGLLGIFVLFKQSLIIKLSQKFAFILPFQKKIKEGFANWKFIPNSTMFVCLVYTMVLFVISVFQCFLLINSFEKVSIVIVFLVFPLVILSNAIPITIGGLGVREGIAVLLLSVFGVSKTAAVSSAFLLFFINTLTPGLFGTLFVSQFKLKKKVKEEVVKEEAIEEKNIKENKEE